MEGYTGRGDIIKVDLLFLESIGVSAYPAGTDTGTL